MEHAHASPDFSAYRNIILSCLSGTTISATISSLTRQISLPSRSNDWNGLDGALYTAWGALLDVVTDLDSFDSKQDILVSLMASLSAEELEGGNYRTDRDQKIWSDLPDWSMVVRDTWNSSPPHVPTKSWTNLNAFLARLTAARVTDVSLYAIWAIRPALEEPTSVEEPLEYILPAAVAWLEHCGTLISKLAREGQGFDDLSASLGSLCRDAGVETLGFSAKRWAFWRTRLQEISASNSESGQQAMRGLSVIRAIDEKLVVKRGDA